MSRRRPRPSKTKAALAATFTSPFLVPRFIGDRQSRIVLQARSEAEETAEKVENTMGQECPYLSVVVLVD